MVYGRGVSLSLSSRAGTVWPGQKLSRHIWLLGIDKMACKDVNLFRRRVCCWRDVDRYTSTNKIEFPACTKPGTRHASLKHLSDCYSVKVAK